MDFTHIYNTFGVFFVDTIVLLFDIKTKDSLKVMKININDIFFKVTLALAEFFKIIP